MEKLYYYELTLGKEQTVVKLYLKKAGNYHFYWHKNIELMLVLRGHVKVYSDRKKHTLEQDDILFINSNSGHSLFVLDPESMLFIMEINPKVFPEANCLKIECESNSESRYNLLFTQIRYLMAKTLFYASKGQEKYLMGIKAYIMALLTELQYNFPSTHDSQDITMNLKEKKDFRNILDYIDINFDKKLKLEEMANIAGYNVTYLATLFRKNVGITFNEYLMRVRLKNAIDNMFDLNISLLDIALKNGFPNSKSFCQCMKEYCGKTPQQYRMEIERSSDKKLIKTREYLVYPNQFIEEKLNSYREGCIKTY